MQIPSENLQLYVLLFLCIMNLIQIVSPCRLRVINVDVSVVNKSSSQDGDKQYVNDISAFVSARFHRRSYKLVCLLTRPEMFPRRRARLPPSVCVHLHSPVSFCHISMVLVARAT